MTLKVIIAEDETDIAELYRDVLSERGHEVSLTTNGKECFELYRLRNTYRSVESRPPFDVVILDYSMPVMDGLQVAKLILGLQPRQRIIFASAYVEDTLVEAIKELEMVVELLQKPFSIDALVHTVEDRNLFEQLAKLNVDIKQLKEWNPDHNQLAKLLKMLTRLRSEEAEVEGLLDANQPDTPAPTSSTAREFLDYENSAYHFSIQYPDDWTKIEKNPQQVTQNSGGTSFVARSPASDAAVTVSVQNLPRLGMSLEEYTRISIEALNKKVSLLNLIESDGTSLAVSGHAAHKVVYTGSLDQTDKNLASVKAMQVWSIIGSRVYLISYAAPPEKFDQYSLSIAQKMIDSFKVDETALATV